MANNPPTNPAQLVQRLRQMAAGVTAYTTGGGTWAGPTAASLTAAALALETLNNESDAAYSAYKQKLSARDVQKTDACVPAFRQVVQAAYLALGKDSEQLRDFGLEPQAATTGATLPDPPPNVTVREVSETAVLVDWDPVAGADRYHVYFGTDMAKMALFGSATASELEVRGLVEGTKYFFYVKAVNSVGESAPSNFTSRRTL